MGITNNAKIESIGDVRMGSIFSAMTAEHKIEPKTKTTLENFKNELSTNKMPNKTIINS